ncbi:MAG: ATP-binding cassette domain-containing protein [Pseudomonadota bacterium]
MSEDVSARKPNPKPEPKPGQPHAPTSERVVLDSLSLTLAGQQVVSELSAELAGAGLTAIMGPNGAGKSLTLRMIAGLIAPDRGSIRFDGVRPEPRDIPLVFQKPVLLRRSAAANLAHTLMLADVPRADRPARVEALLNQAGLADRARSPARRLSGGEQQRLALVRALASGPRFLLLDEPTASLDPASTASIEALIRGAAAAGTRVLLVTHDRHQAARLADEVLVLHRGRLVEAGPAADVLERAGTPEARAYFAGELLT